MSNKSTRFFAIFSSLCELSRGDIHIFSHHPHSRSAAQRIQEKSRVSRQLLPPVLSRQFSRKLPTSSRALPNAVSRKHAASRIITLGVSELLDSCLNALSSGFHLSRDSGPEIGGGDRRQGADGIRRSTPLLLYDQESVQPASPSASQPASHPATPWNIDM